MAENNDEIMADEHSDSDDSDSSFEEVDASEEDMQLITQVEEELQNNPNQYDKHIQVRQLTRILECWRSVLVEATCNKKSREIDETAGMHEGNNFQAKYYLQ